MHVQGLELATTEGQGARAGEITLETVKHLHELATTLAGPASFRCICLQARKARWSKGITRIINLLFDVSSEDWATWRRPQVQGTGGHQYDTTNLCVREMHGKWRLYRNRYDEPPLLLDDTFDSHEAAWRLVAKVELDERVAYMEGVSALYDAIRGRTSAASLPARCRP